MATYELITSNIHERRAPKAQTYNSICNLCISLNGHGKLIASVYCLKAEIAFHMWTLIPHTYTTYYATQLIEKLWVAVNC